MDADTTEILSLLPCKPEKIPPRLTRALRRAKSTGVVREDTAPDGETYLMLGSERNESIREG